MGGESVEGSNVEVVGVGRPPMPRPAENEFEREWESGVGGATRGIGICWAIEGGGDGTVMVLGREANEMRVRM